MTIQRYRAGLTENKSVGKGRKRKKKGRDGVSSAEHWRATNLAAKLNFYDSKLKYLGQAIDLWS